MQREKFGQGRQPTKSRRKYVMQLSLFFPCNSMDYFGENKKTYGSRAINDPVSNPIVEDVLMVVKLR